MRLQRATMCLRGELGPDVEKEDGGDEHEANDQHGQRLPTHVSVVQNVVVRSKMQHTWCRLRRNGRGKRGRGGVKLTL